MAHHHPMIEELAASVTDHEVPAIASATSILRGLPRTLEEITGPVTTIEEESQTQTDCTLTPSAPLVIPSQTCRNPPHPPEASGEVLAWAKSCTTWLITIVKRFWRIDDSKWVFTHSVCWQFSLQFRLHQHSPNHRPRKPFS